MTSQAVGNLSECSAVLRPPQAAAVLGLSVHTLATMRVRGGGPTFYKLGRAVAYRLTDLMDWFNARARRSTSDKGGNEYGSNH